MGAEEQLREVLVPVVQARGLEIWDVERSGASVKVLVERPGGIDLDALSELSNAISTVLDRHDDLVPAGRYVLEVSSPGLERRLRHARHFACSVGEEVVVKTTEPFGGSRRLTGTLLSASGTDITLRLSSGGDEVATAGQGAENGEQVLRIPLASIVRAHRVFRWPDVKTSSGAGRKARPKTQRPGAGERHLSPQPATPVAPAVPAGGLAAVGSGQLAGAGKGDQPDGVGSDLCAVAGVARSASGPTSASEPASKAGGGVPWPA